MHTGALLLISAVRAVPLSRCAVLVAANAPPSGGNLSLFCDHAQLFHDHAALLSKNVLLFYDHAPLFANHSLLLSRNTLPSDGWALLSGGAAGGAGAGFSGGGGNFSCRRGRFLAISGHSREGGQAVREDGLDDIAAGPGVQGRRENT